MLKRHRDIDLLAAVVLTVLLIILFFFWPGSWLQALLGLLFLIFVPGYVLTAAIFPRQESLEVVVRVALSFGLSIVAGVIIGLLLGISPFGFQPLPIIVAMSLFTWLAAAVVWYLRRRLGEGTRIDIKLGAALGSVAECFKNGSQTYRGLVIAIVCMVIIGLVAYGLLIREPDREQPFTEFYILDESGLANEYPVEVRAGEPANVIIGVVNREGRETSYTLRVDSGGHDSPETLALSLAPGEVWQDEVSLTLRQAGAKQPVKFLLFKAGDASPQALYLWVDAVGQDNG